MTGHFCNRHDKNLIKNYDFTYKVRALQLNFAIILFCLAFDSKEGRFCRAPLGQEGAQEVHSFNLRFLQYLRYEVSTYFVRTRMKIFSGIKK